MLEDGLGASETDGELDDSELLREAHAALGSADKFKGEHSAEAGHLGGGQLMSGMRVKARVVDPLDISPGLEEARQLESGFVLAQSSQLQGLQAANQEPGLERAQGGSEYFQEAPAAIDDFRRGADHSGGDIGVPADGLGGGVDHGIESQGDGVLVYRGSEGVIDY